VRTIIFHEPALASVFAGVRAGKTSVERMSLLQLEVENARTKKTAMEINLRRAVGFEVMELLAFRRRGCT
jgi:hypothetical protein